MDADLGAEGGLAGETGLFYLRKAHHAVFGSVNSIVAAEEGARTSYFGAASLTNKHLTRVDRLATKALHAKALPGIVVDVLA